MLLFVGLSGLCVGVDGGFVGGGFGEGFGIFLVHCFMGIILITSF